MQEKEGQSHSGRDRARIGRSGMVSRIRHLRRVRYAEIAGGEPCDCGTCAEGLAGISEGFAERRPVQGSKVVPSTGTDTEEATTQARSDVMEYLR